MFSFREPPKKFDSCNYNFGDLNSLVKKSYPGLGAEYCSDFMKKFGYTVSGIYDGWELKSKEKGDVNE